MRPFLWSANREIAQWKHLAKQYIGLIATFEVGRQTVAVLLGRPVAILKAKTEAVRNDIAVEVLPEIEPRFL